MNIKVEFNSEKQSDTFSYEEIRNKEGIYDLENEDNDYKLLIISNAVGTYPIYITQNSYFYPACKDSLTNHRYKLTNLPVTVTFSN